MTALIFDDDEFSRALRGDNPIERELARLMCRYKLATEDIAAVAAELHKRLWKEPEAPEPARGRPVKWTDEDKLYAWIAIEGQLRADREIEAGCSIRESIQAKFDAMPRRGPRVWLILADMSGNRPHLVIDTPETARKYHREGAAILGSLSMAQQERLSSVADCVAHSINKKRLGKKIATK